MIERVVSWFSCGVTSAIASQLALEKYRNIYKIVIAFCDTGSEDEDNYRFLTDIENWINKEIIVLKNPKYADTFAVYEASGYFKNQYGAKCTTVLKRNVRESFQDLEKDLQIFGYHAGERSRANKFIENFPEIQTEFPLINKGIDKNRAREILKNVGIKEPRTYSEGFTNANCLRTGCIKGGIGYWNHIRVVRPEAFWNMAAEERKLGYAILATETIENGKRIKQPIYLDELPKHIGNHKNEPPIQCNLFTCGDLDGGVGMIGGITNE